jgi:potassium efflux system protein
LLEAKYDQSEAELELIGERIQVLDDLIDRKRRQAAAQATTAAEQTQRELEGMHPVLVELSAENAALTRDVNDITQQLQAQDLVRQNLEQVVEQLDADYQDARETLESGEVNDDLGRILLQQFDALPDLGALVQNDAQRRDEIADLTVRRLEHRAEARRIADADATVARLMLEMQADAGRGPRPRPQAKAKLELVQQRQTLLEQALETYQLYLGKLRELDRAEQALLATAAEYDAYLDEQLPWLRNAKPIRLDDIRAMPSELGARLAARTWRACRADRPAARDSPVFWLALIGAAVLLVRRRAIIARHRIGHAPDQQAHHRPHALYRAGAGPDAAARGAAAPAAGGRGLAAPGRRRRNGPVPRPGRCTHHGPPSTCPSCSAGRDLPAARVGGGAFPLARAQPELLRAQLRLFVWPFVAAVIIVNVALGINPAETGGTLAKLALVLGYLPLSWFLYRVFHPRHGVLAHLRSGGDYPMLFRAYLIWYPLLVGAPLALLALAWTGYVYTATTFSYLFLLTLWFLFAWCSSNALALRWLQVTRRRLAYDAAMERRRAELEEAEQQEDARRSGRAAVRGGGGGHRRAERRDTRADPHPHAHRDRRRHLPDLVQRPAGAAHLRRSGALARHRHRRRRGAAAAHHAGQPRPGVALCHRHLGAGRSPPGAVGDPAAAALPDDRRRSLYPDHLDHLCRGRGGAVAGAQHPGCALVAGAMAGGGAQRRHRLRPAGDRRQLHQRA